MDHGAIGGGQIDFDSDLNELFLVAMVQRCLLGAVAADVATGELRELGEGSEKRDQSDVRASLGRRKGPEVFAEERAIVTLAEEVGFADSLVGQGAIEGKGRWRSQTERQKQNAEDAQGVTHGKSLGEIIEQKNGQADNKSRLPLWGTLGVERAEDF